ncbi:CvpA family protein [uncultured Duncaniella sp.]|uniref:CvpA family protein n=1 Tax=uncultured Duncaniella sp. TaxID=2768039 RepID=UPI00265B0E08|nr:CvpA family protein [uncultured Duncaniella sp.]
MPTIDIIILIVFAVSAVMGFRKGLITQVGSVAAIIIGIIACRMFGSQVAGMITPSGGPGVNFMSNYGASILACCIIYIVAYYCVIIVAKFLKLVTHTLLLGPLDHIAGAVVNILKWFMVMSVALNLYMVVFSGTDINKASRLGDGRLVTWIIDLAPSVWGALNNDNGNEQ